MKTVHTWLAGFPGPPASAAEGADPEVEAPFVLARSCPVVPRESRWAPVGLCGSGPPGSLFSLLCPGHTATSEQVLGARNPGTAGSVKEKTTHAITWCMPRLPGKPESPAVQSSESGP